jgi:hypothetical protein
MTFTPVSTFADVTCIEINIWLWSIRLIRIFLILASILDDVVFIEVNTWFWAMRVLWLWFSSVSVLNDVAFTEGTKMIAGLIQFKYAIPFQIFISHLNKEISLHHHLYHFKNSLFVHFFFSFFSFFLFFLLFSSFFLLSYEICFFASFVFFNSLSDSKNFFSSLYFTSFFLIIIMLI